MDRKLWTIGMIQMDSGEDEAANLDKVSALVKQAAHSGASVVMLPETADYIGKDMKGHGKPVSGKLGDFFSELAKEAGVYLHCGSVTEQTEGLKPRNTTLFYTPEGVLAARYSKLHLFDVEIPGGVVNRESDQIQGGDSAVLVSTKLGRFGFAICYDIRFPELFRILAQNGASVIFVCANFTDTTGKAHWETLLRARAIENGCYIAACGQTGEKWNYRAHGNSMLVDPWGRILARADAKEQILLGQIDLDLVDVTRKQIPCLKNLRQDIYEWKEKSVKIYGE